MSRKANDNSPANRSQRSLRGHIVVGVALIALLVGGIGLWSATASIAGAVIAPGRIVVETNVKRVQHDEGGVVGEINVRDGDFVEAGDLLIRLDDTLTAASLAIIQGQIRELTARRTRLMAERDGQTDLVFETTATDTELGADLINSETSLFEARLESRTRQEEQLRAQIGQIGDEVRGLETQFTARTREIELIRDELAGVLELAEKDLVPKSRVIALQREETRLVGESGQLQAQIAEAQRRASEIEIEILKLEEEFRAQVLEKLSQIRLSLNELREQEIAALDRLKRVEIRAPRRGFVHQLTVHTVGGVIGAGETAMLIVPDEDNLIVEARVGPQDIDQLSVGQEVVLRFSGLNQRTTPELRSTLSGISPDIAMDDQTGEQFYLVRISLPREQLARLGDAPIVPGMPVDTFIQTNHRTVIAYLLQPITDHLQKVFREA